MNPDVTIRMATEADAEEILKIYSLYITDTAITFEYDIPSVTEFSQRIKHTLHIYLPRMCISTIQARLSMNI